MKRIILLGAAAMAFSGCAAVPGLILYTDSLTLTSDYVADVPGDGTSQNVPVICDDRVTNVTYSFRYAGDLASWRSQLVGSFGNTTNSQNYTVVGNPPSNGVATATYTIRPAGAPLSQPGGTSAQSLKSQAIVVVPNVKVIGQTNVRISVTNSSGDRTSSVDSNSLPVVDNCADAIPL